MMFLLTYPDWYGFAKGFRANHARLLSGVFSRNNCSVSKTGVFRVFTVYSQSLPREYGRFEFRCKFTTPLLSARPQCCRARFRTNSAESRGCYACTSVKAHVRCKTHTVDQVRRPGIRNSSNLPLNNLIF